MITISAHQPNYIPWLGYFYKIYKSDITVFIDDVQYSNEGMHNYNYIKSPKGILKLKIPVNQTLGDKIFQVTTKDFLNWKSNHLGLIEEYYSKAKFFEEVFTDFSMLFQVHYQNIAKQNASIIELIAKKLNIQTRLIYSSSLNISSTREERILDIITKLNGNIYYSGTGAKAYQSEQKFNERNIKLVYSDFRPFPYPQLWGPFCPNVSILDYLMNCGYDWDRVIYSQGKHVNNRE